MRNNHLGAVSCDTLVCFANAQVQVDLFQMTRSVMPRYSISHMSLLPGMALSAVLTGITGRQAGTGGKHRQELGQQGLISDCRLSLIGSGRCR